MIHGEGSARVSGRSPSIREHHLFCMSVLMCVRVVPVITSKLFFCMTFHDCLGLGLSFRGVEETATLLSVKVQALSLSIRICAARPLTLTLGIWRQKGWLFSRENTSDVQGVPR